MVQKIAPGAAGARKISRFFWEADLGTSASPLIRWFEDVGAGDVAIVGGKNASLGQLLRVFGGDEIPVPRGFATTAEAYWAFVRGAGLDAVIDRSLARLEAGELVLAEAGREIRAAIEAAPLPDDLAAAIRSSYRELSQSYGSEAVDVAVRSSATAEDLPDASFAGQQATFLAIVGEEAVLDACRRCIASLFTDRAISYREQKGFDHRSVALSIGVQKMVRSDRGGSGVMFTLHTETGFPKMVVINAAWGLGETVVGGEVTPDEYQVYKPLLARAELSPIVEKSLGAKERKLIYGEGAATQLVDTSAEEAASFVLSDAQILKLARWACRIEDSYGGPMDIEWAWEREGDQLYIVQARPETVRSRRGEGLLKTYRLLESGPRILDGLAIGEGVASGPVFLARSLDDAEVFTDGSILVTSITDPDWVPVMKRAAGIITDRGGRTSHAAIVSRELGVPAVIGTGEATRTLLHGQEVTLSCAEGERGQVYEGRLAFESTDVDLSVLEPTETRVMLNIASPEAALRWWSLPADGVGLARLEFIINNVISIHPMALVRFDEIGAGATRDKIERLTVGYEEKTEYFVDKLARGIAKIAAVSYPRPVIVRTSDFKTNEYAHLIGGGLFEPQEENPMLGFRGASRYYSEAYREGFALECKAIKRAREGLGFDNVVVMIPFCRTLGEADRVQAVMAEEGLKRGENGLELYVMCEVPSNVILAEGFAERFDGFSIGSNDLTQLTLGVDRDSESLAHLFDERDAAVKAMIERVITVAHAAGRKVGLCGQGPSDHPDFAAFLVELGIDSMSLNPDSFVGVKRVVAELEARRGQESEA